MTAIDRDPNVYECAKTGKHVTRVSIHDERNRPMWVGPAPLAGEPIVLFIDAHTPHQPLPHGCDCFAASSRYWCDNYRPLAAMPVPEAQPNLIWEFDPQDSSVYRHAEGGLYRKVVIHNQHAVAVQVGAMLPDERRVYYVPASGVMPDDMRLRFLDCFVTGESRWAQRFSPVDATT